MKKHPKFSWHRLSAELKRRRVYPVIAGYAIVGWIILQIGEVTFEPLNLPGWVMVSLIVFVILGFPLVIMLAWVFDLTESGIRRDRKTFAISARGDTQPIVAVLPFMDLSPGGDQEYFCAGVAEEILSALTRIPNLQVVARSSSFQFAGSAGDVREIGEALGANAILEGSVRKSDGHVRVTAQLVKARDGCHMWSKQFDTELKDVFSVQDGSKDITAYDCYLRGRQFLRRFRKTDIECARDMFHHALDIDPYFSLAWASYADCCSLLVMYEDPNPDYREKAMSASKRALELDPDLAEAHASSGLAAIVCEDYESAESAFRNALKLNPELFEAHYYYGRAKFHMGDLDGAAELFRSAAEIDPMDYKSRCLRAQILRGQKRMDEAIKEAKEAVAVVEKNLQWNPDDASGYHLGAASLILLGETEKAKHWLQRALEMDSDDSVLLYNIACNLATMGETDNALKYLEQAVEHGVINAAWMRNDADLDSLRGESRFVDMLGRLEEAHNDACGIT
jgi:adenylate cyclase